MCDDLRTKRTGRSAAPIVIHATYHHGVVSDVLKQVPYN